MPGSPLTRQSRVILAERDGDPEWWDDVFDRVACGERLKDIAAEYCVLAGQMSVWIETRPELAKRYGEALRARGNIAVEDVIPIADGKMPAAAGVEPSESRDRLRVEARERMAERWNRERYGKRTDVAVKHTVGVDVGLIGVASALLAQRRGVVIDVTPAVDEPVLPPVTQSIERAALEVSAEADAEVAASAGDPPIPSVPVPAQAAPVMPPGGWL